MAAPPPQPPRGTMSLYADLIGGGSTETAPAPAATKPEAPKNPALRFQPIIRRPQQNAKGKAKPKGGLPSSTKPPSQTTTSNTPTITSTSVTTQKASTTTATVQPHTSHLGTAPARTSLADWTSGGNGDDDYYEGDEGGGGYDDARKWPQRGGRKRKKKRLEDRQRMTERDAYIVDWDELYDPARPTNIEAYLRSDEHIEASHAWKTVLYASRRERQRAENEGKSRRLGSDDDSSSSSGDERRPQQLNNAFAPPPPAAFAPPASYDMPPAGRHGSPSPSLSTQTQTHKPSTSPTRPAGLVVSKAPIRFAPAVSEDHDMEDGDSNKDDVDDDDDDYRPTMSGDASADADTEQLRANRPGQAGFAARLMSKYGWTKGSGLGADESGIINPLRHKKVGKSGAIGRIVGGGGGNNSSSNNNRKPDDDDAAKISPVIILRNMVTGLPDLDAEVADGQLVQDIGEECGAQYGRIERVYIDVPGQLVFIKFTESVSALRAVNALNGRIFNGNAIVPSFYDADKFEEGIYE